MKSIALLFYGILLCLPLSHKLQAQCQTSITALNTAIGNNGTATITTVTTGTTNPMFLTDNWQVTPGTTQNNQNGQFQFFANGTYTVCLTIIDSLYGCISNEYCTHVTISNLASSTCHAAFTAYTDSNCVTHFQNTSTGSGLSYRWKIDSVYLYSANPSASLINGSHQVLLEAYNGSQLCDTIIQTIYVGCSGTNTLSCSSDFTYYVDSCVTHFYQTSTGNNLSFEWYQVTNQGTTLLSTSPNPALNLLQGYNEIHLATFSNGAFCDSAVKIINVNCPGPPLGCLAVSHFFMFADSVNPASGNYFAYNTSYGSETMSYLWNFGDGTTSTQQYPFHQYAVPGQYIICLTVTSTEGTVTCSDMFCDSSSVQKTASFLMSQMNVVPQTTAGIKEIRDALTVQVFPNPINDYLAIKTTTTNGFTFQLINSFGQITVQGSSKAPELLINTDSLKQGFYTLRISEEMGTGIQSFKLVK